MYSCNRKLLLLLLVGFCVQILSETVIIGITTSKEYSTYLLLHLIFI